MRITLGNLFSGSGTWELAAQLCGITPMWEAEIEKFPVELEAKRFPMCKQLGDVTQIDGSKIEPVDIITSSSPCQDLSIAGGRKGLSGQRSRLFLECIRITKEMRCATNELFPRFWLWENVPGAFSSSHGADFQQVLQSVCQIKDKGAYIPLPPKEKWHTSGVVDGNGFQVAWKTLDAQFMGVPQRRRRIFLVADFDGYCAEEILSVSQGLHWNFEQVREIWQDHSRTIEERIETASRIIQGE